MAPNKRPTFSTSVSELPSKTKPNVQKVVQSGLVPEPWKELLELVAPLPAQTRAEAIAGRMALLRHKLEEEQEAYRTMLNWDTFDAQVQGYAGSADADAMFRLEDFVKLNDALAIAMRQWGLTGIRAAVVRISERGTEVLRVKALLPPADKFASPQSVIFDEPADGPFPSDELLTKMQLINPGGDYGETKDR